MNDKYIVLKRKHFEGLMEDSRSLVAEYPVVSRILERLEELELPDAEVIRHQDLFAAPGLFAYANVIQTGLDLMFPDGPVEATREVRSHLADIRDYFWQAAQESNDHPHKKIPD